jgi:hypothetical protein
MKIDPNDLKTRPFVKPYIIAHDVGQTRHRSTAVIGGNYPFNPAILGVTEFHELPQGLIGHDRAEALAQFERRCISKPLIIEDASNDRTCAELLCERIGPRVIGLHISRSGDGKDADWWPVKNGRMLVYTIGRTYLLDSLRAAFDADQIRLIDNPASRLAYKQLAELEVELRNTGRLYTCPRGAA